MKLIYAKGACSLSVHIMLEELGVSYDALRVSLQDKTVLDSYNPKSYVPALILDDGTLMTEAIAILQYLSDTHKGRFMPQGRAQKAKCIEWLSYLSSELHKGIGPLFHRNDLGERFLKSTMDKVATRLLFLDEALEESDFVVEEYSIADMYALAILRIIDHVGLSLEEYTNILRYKEQLEARPIVKKVLEEEEEARVETEPRKTAIRPESEASRDSRALR